MSCDPIRLVPGPPGQNSTPGTNGTNGVNAFTILTGEFAIPDQQLSDMAEVEQTDFMAAGESLYLQGAGTFQVVAIVDGTHVSLKNLRNDATGAYADNWTIGNTAPIGSALVPTGIQGKLGTDGTNGIDGTDAVTTLGAALTMPVEGATNPSVLVASSDGLAIGETVFIEDLGFLRVVSVPDSTHAIFRNIANAASGAYQQNAVAGTVAAIGNKIISAGIQGPSGLPYCCFQQRQNANMAAGTFTQAVWQTFDLNYTVHNAGFATLLAGGSFDLATGTYRCKWRLQAYNVNAFTSRFYDTFTPATISLGSSGQALFQQQMHSFGEARFVQAAANNMALQGLCATTKATDGRGIQSNLGVQEVYSSLELWKEA